MQLVKRFAISSLLRDEEYPCIMRVAAVRNTTLLSSKHNKSVFVTSAACMAAECIRQEFLHAETEDRIVSGIDRGMSSRKSGEP